MKKTIYKFIAVIAFLAIILNIANTVAFADENEDITFSSTLLTSKQNIIPGEEFEVNFNISDLGNIEKGVIAVGGSLKYDKEVLELVEMNSQDDWSRPEYNESNGKFVMDRNEFVTSNSNVLKLKFKANESITEQVSTNISIGNIVVSNGRRDVYTTDVQVQINVKLKEEILISSDKYLVDEPIISRIAPGTTAAEFKQNVVSKESLVVVDKEGNPITDETVIGTWFKVKVGEKTEYTLSVYADIDGNSEITLTDLAKVKLHLIEKELLIDAVQLKAADIDNNNEINLIDLAKIKLILVGKLVIEK